MSKHRFTDYTKVREFFPTGEHCGEYWGAEFLDNEVDPSYTFDTGADGLPVVPRFRFKLWRVWDTNKRIGVFVGLNPSSATERKNDPTITRCINYCKSWGLGGYVMLNLFPFRSTDPRKMEQFYEREEEQAIAHLTDQINLGIIEHMRAQTKVEFFIAAWGTRGGLRHMAEKVFCTVEGRMHCLRITKDGHPQHPLYLPGDLDPIPFSMALTTSTRRRMLDLHG